MRPFFRKIAILAAAAMLTACSPASCDTLYRKASHMHGKCTIVSKSESDSANTVIVHDEPLLIFRVGEFTRDKDNLGP